MIFEHEIPAGSHFYFGQNAKEKRQVEKAASELLTQRGFEEIATPLFSYHQHQGLRDTRALIRLSDTQNREVTLRADSTIDVVRLVTKRLGKTTKQKKWFYIQPVFHYPTQEINQIGAEFLGGTLAEVLDVTISLFDTLDLHPILQISNMQIPLLISKMYDIPLEWFASMQVEKLLNTDYPWIGDLIKAQHANHLSLLMDKVPAEIAKELQKILDLIEKSEYDQCILAPLYYAKMRYYDGLFFKCFAGNTPLAKGGHIMNDDITAAGFSLYTDAVIEQRFERG